MATCTVAPTEEPVTLTEVKAAAVVTHAGADSRLTSLIKTARLRVEGYTGRALLPQQWELILSADDMESIIALPKPPLQAVLGVWAVDFDRAETLIDAATYYGVDTHSAPGRLLLRPDVSWPADSEYMYYRVLCLCGYPTVGAVPEILREAIIRTVVTLYENPGDAVTGTVAAKLPLDVQELLNASGLVIPTL